MGVFYLILCALFSEISFNEADKFTRVVFDLGPSVSYEADLKDNKITILLNNIPFKSIPIKSYKGKFISKIELTPDSELKSNLVLFLKKTDERSFDSISFYQDANKTFVVDLWLIDNKILADEEKLIAVPLSNIDKKSKIKLLPKDLKVKKVNDIKAKVDNSVSKLDLPVFFPEDSNFSDPEILRYKFDKVVENDLNKYASSEDNYIEYPILVQKIDLSSEVPEFNKVDSQTEDANYYNLIVALFKENKFGYALRTIKYFFDNYKKSKYTEDLSFLKAEIYYSMYKRLESRSFLEQAIDDYNIALSKFPVSKRGSATIEKLGKIYLDNDFNYRALEVFEKAISRYPDSDNVFVLKLAQSVSLLKLGYSGKSLNVLKRVYLESVNRFNKTKKVEYIDMAAEAIFRLGDIYLTNKNYNKSIESYLKAFEIFPENEYILKFPNAIFNTAQSYFMLKEYNKSLDFFRSFVKNFPDHKFSSLAMNRIGECLNLLGASFEQVKSAYLESTFRYPDSFGSSISKVRLAANSIVVSQEKDLPQFFNLIDKIIVEKEYPGIDIFCVIIKGESLVKRGIRLSKPLLIIQAIDLWKSYIREQPLSSFYTTLKNKIEFAISELIELYSLEQDYYLLVTTYESDIDSFIERNNTIDLSLVVAEAYLHLSLPSKAKPIIEAYEEKGRDKNKRLYLLLKAELLFNDNKYEEAYKLLKNFEALGFTPDKNYRYYGRILDRHKFNFYYLMSKYYKHKNDFEKYKINITEAISKYSANDKDFLFSLNFELALLFYKNKKFEEAVVKFKKVSEEFKDSSSPLLKESFFYIAHSYYELKNYEEAIKNYVIAIKAYDEFKDSDMAKYRICSAYIKLKDKVKIKTCLNNFSKGNNSVWLKLAKEELKSFEKSQ